LEERRRAAAAANEDGPGLSSESFERAKANGRTRTTALAGRSVVARRAAGEAYYDEGATLDDLHKAVTILEDTERIARRVFGGTHPKVAKIELSLRKSRAALRARETPPARDTA